MFDLFQTFIDKYGFFSLLMFFFVLQFVFYVKDGLIHSVFRFFLSRLQIVFDYSVSFGQSYILSSFIFILLFFSCFGGYICYSYCPVSIFQITLYFSLVSWLSTFICLCSSEKFFVRMCHKGDGYFKNLFLFVVEIVSEFSRPIALTVRLLVNILVGHLISHALFLGTSLLFGGFVFFGPLVIIMECFVFVIQSYIFSRLIYLYLSE